MRLSNRSLSQTAIVALIAFAAGLAGCGDGKEDRSKLLSATRASDLRASLDAAEQMLNDGNCVGAANTVVAFQQKVSALPARLSSSLRDALAAGATHLERLVESQCESVGTTGPTGPTVQAPEETNEDGPGKKGKGKAKGHDKNKDQEIPEEGTTGPTGPTGPDSGGASTGE